MREFFTCRGWLGAIAMVGGISLSAGGALAQTTEYGLGASATGVNATAIGTGATASGDLSTAVGTAASTTGQWSVAVGDSASVEGPNGVAIGYLAKSTSSGGIAIGIAAQSTHDGSIAIGGGSSTTRGAQVSYAAPFLTTSQTSDGEFSVGGDTISGEYDVKRQITNVAAGSQATDAVNLAQLQGAFAPLREDLDALTGRVGRLESRVDDVRDIAIAAGALSMAAAQLRFDDRPGKLSIAMGGGAFHGKGAGAIGIGYTSPDRLWRANVSGSFTEGETAFGGGLSFTLN